MIVHSRITIDGLFQSGLNEDELTDLMLDKFYKNLKSQTADKVEILKKNSFVDLDEITFIGSIAVLSPDEYHYLREVEREFNRLREYKG